MCLAQPNRSCRWLASGLLRQLAARKRVFREPRSAGEVEACLTEYADCIASAAAGGSSARGASSSGGGGGGGSGSKAVATLGSAGKPAVHAAQSENSSGNQGGGSRAGGSGGSGGSALSGAVMLCVVGGKLAEGINFGDALGRCVLARWIAKPFLLACSSADLFSASLILHGLPSPMRLCT